jgi:predicted hydrocarbon binding protein
MTTSAQTTGMLSISSNLFHNLRRSIERAAGNMSPQILQEVGFSSGEEMYDAFADWLRDTKGVDAPEELDASFLADILSEFFAHLRWGQLTIERVGPAALAIDASNWVENIRSPDDAVGPICHFSTGVFAALFGRLAEDVVAVMEVDSPDAGHGVCRFLVGAPETLQAVFEAISEGRDYHAILTSASHSDS